MVEPGKAPEDNGDEDGTNETLFEPISADGTPRKGERYSVPARHGRAVRLRAGQQIRIINTHGTQVCDTWAFKADALNEFLSMEHMRAWLNRMSPKPGDPLVTNRRRAILTLLEDSSPGVHDTFIAACDLYRFRTLGVEGYHDNCADNLRMAMKAIGARVGEVPSPLNLWMNIPIASDLTIDWLPPVSRPGDHVTLRAEMDCIVAMSACPQDIVPINGKACSPVEIHFEVAQEKGSHDLTLIAGRKKPIQLGWVPPNGAVQGIKQVVSQAMLFRSHDLRVTVIEAQRSASLQRLKDCGLESEVQRWYLTKVAGDLIREGAKGIFSRSRPYNFHIELTDKCNAACPMCPRTDHLDRCRPNREKVKNIELSLADIKQHFDLEFCQQVEQIDLCGGLGDPIAASQCLEICEYLTAQGITLSISTNAALRNVGWWKRLGEAFSDTPSFVEFHIDGLADTNALYRIKTQFEKIMTNARAYLETGAEAEWHYILFKHNEHEVEEARDLARDMGFRKFVLIDSIRFGAKNHFDYQMPSGAWRRLEPSTRSFGGFAPRGGEPAAKNVAGTAEGAGGPEGSAEIRCKSVIENRPYITADGNVSACCWTAVSEEERMSYETNSLDRRQSNLHFKPLSEILHEEPFASLYDRTWLQGGNPICRRKCGQMLRNRRLAV